MSDGLSNAAPHLSIVIPAFNEEERLPLTLARLHAYLTLRAFSWEIIVVSNGSTDRTADVTLAAAATMPNLHLMTIEQRGKGIAARTGVLESRGELVFLCDADMSMPPEMIDAFLDAASSHDIVIGSREAPGAVRTGEPRLRHVMGRVFNRIVQVFAIRGLNDTQCGFKLFRRSAAHCLFELQTVNGFGFDVELLYLARKFGYTLFEVPVEWRFDTDTRVRPGIDTIDMLREIFMMRVRDAAGQYRVRVQAPASE